MPAGPKTPTSPPIRFPTEAELAVVQQRIGEAADDLAQRVPADPAVLAQAGPVSEIPSFGELLSAGPDDLAALAAAAREPEAPRG